MSLATKIIPITVYNPYSRLFNLPENTILATMDVESLCTNIPCKDGLQATRKMISGNTMADLPTKL